MAGPIFNKTEDQKLNKSSSTAVIPENYFKYKPAKGQEELNMQKKKQVLQLKDLLPEPRKKTKEETLQMIRNYKEIMKGQIWKKEMFDLNAKPALLKSEYEMSAATRENMGSASQTSIKEVSTA